MNKDIYQVKIVYTDAGNKVERMPYRIMQFHKDTNLQQFAHHILKSFGFKLSEPFGFYSDPELWHKSESKYELFEEDPKKNTLKNTFIDDIFGIQKEYLMIYDYLEEFRFLIFFDKTVPERNAVPYPEIIESMGETKNESEVTLNLDEEDDEPKYGAKKQTGSIKDEFDDYDNDDVEKLNGREGDEDDEASDDEGGSEFGLEEYGSGGYDDDLK